MLQTWRLILTFSVLVLGVSCSPRNPIQPCADLLDAKSYDEAVNVCAAIFDETGNADAAAGAARANFALGKADDVRVWHERLLKTPKAGIGWALLGRLHYQQGEAGEAVAAFENALPHLQLDKDHGEAARTLYFLFYITWDQGRYREALAYSHAAAEAAAQAGDTAMEATALGGVFTIHYELGDLEGAQQAAEAAREKRGKEKLAYSHSFLGTLLLDQQRPVLARDALNKVLEHATGDEDRRFYRSTYLNLVRAHLDLGDVERAADDLANAWEYAEPEEKEQSALLSFQAQIEQRQGRYDEAAATLRRALAQDPHNDWLVDLGFQLGEAEEARGNRQAALEAYANAAATVEELRQDLGFDDFKPWLLAKRRRPFEALFRLHAAAEDVNEALAVVERAKARTFLDAFIHATAETPTPDDLAARMDFLNDLVPALSESLGESFGASPGAVTRPIPELLAALADHHVLVYFRAGETLWQIVVRNGQATPRPLTWLNTDGDASDSHASRVEDMVRRFIANPDDSASASALAKILLPPGSLPEDGARLFVAADRPLDRVPFAALRLGDRFLVEDHTIVYTPSLNALAAIGTPASEKLVSEKPVSENLIIGDPRSDLPAARREAETVAQNLGSKAWLGEDADRQALLNQSQDPLGVLHLATHSGSDAGGPWLALADGDVRGREIIAQRLAPDLAVLASCAGASRAGLGMWSSLGAAFLAAGSRHVVAALGSVEDDTAHRFVLRFYAAGGAQDAPGSLAEAQRQAIAAGEPPSTWSPFVVLGRGGNQE